MVAEFLVSPNRRRMVSKVRIGAVGTRQLRSFGWMDYDGPAQITVSKHPRKRGWIIPGTDPILDDERLAITGTFDLGIPRTVAEK